VPCRSRRRSSGPWGRQTRHVAYRPDDLGGQYGSHAEDLYEAGTGGFHLGLDALVQVRDLSLQCPDSKRKISEASRRRRRSETTWGRMLRKMRAARWVESVPLPRRGVGP